MPAEKITIYQKPTCSTCRKVYKALLEMDVDVESVNYYTDPLSEAQLKAILRKMRIGVKELLRTKEALYNDLKLGVNEFSDEELLDLMVKHPDLIQRPIVEKGMRAILARPAERLKELF
jgi:arsenate reductase